MNPGLLLTLLLAVAPVPAGAPLVTAVPVALPQPASGALYPRPFDPTEEQALQAMAEWYDDPVSFVRANFQAEPDAWQIEALNSIAKDPKRRVALSACKGPGKSCVEAWAILWFMATRVDAQVVAVSITGDNLRDGLWKELASWMGKSPYLQRCFEHKAERITHRERPKTWWCSARSFAQSADVSSQASTLAGLHNASIMVVLDEAGDMPDGLVVAAEAIFATKGQEARLLLAANPTSVDGPLYRILTKDAKRWVIITITGDPDDPKRSPRIDLDYARNLIDDWGRDNDFVRVNVLGLFPAVGEKKLLGPDHVTIAEGLTVSESIVRDEPIVFSLDVGRASSGDPSALYKRQGAAVWRPKEWRGLDGNQLGDQIATILLEHEKEDGRPADYLVVDEGGVGASPVDRLKALGFGSILIEVPFGGSPIDKRFADRRSEMWWNMAQAIKKRQVALPPGDGVLRGELTAPDFTFRIRQKRTVGCLETKEEMAKRGIKSPNRGDALALSYAAPVSRRPRNEIEAQMMNAAKHGWRSSRVLSDWDPLAKERV